VPSSWQESISRRPGDLPPTIEYAPAGGNGFSVQIAPIWSSTGDRNFNRLEVIHPVIESIGRQQLEQAVETEIVLKEVRGPEVAGDTFTVTDRAPKDGEWKYLTEGAAGIGDLLPGGTILTNSLDFGELRQALIMIEGSRLAADTVPVPTPTTGKTSEAGSLRKLTYPGKTWSLVADLPGFEFNERVAREDMAGVRVSGTNKDTGILISVVLEKAERDGDAKAARAFYWSMAKRTKPRPREVTFSERDTMAVVEHTIDRDESPSIHVKHVNASMSHEGVWIHIHLSKAGFGPEDRSFFETILRSVHILEPAPQAGGGASAAPSRASFLRFLPILDNRATLVLDTLGASLTASPL
jgi:hypothetical protein